jgi:ubiquinone/menaquinone biosynthesis C-methylase UbiE
VPFPARLLPPWTPPQRNRAELLDQKQGSEREVEKSLRDIARINRYLGGAAVVENALWPLLEGRKRATILDIGTGSADIPRRLVQSAAKRGVELQIIAADLLERHLSVAQRDCEGFPTIHPLAADAFSLPILDGGVDVVLASLFLHHFRPPEIIALLREFERVSRIGFICNDTVRDNVPLAFFRLTAPVFAKSYLTRYDGAASILRAYTVEEMREVVESSGVKAEVKEHFPYRLSVVHHKIGVREASASQALLRPETG